MPIKLSPEEMEFVRRVERYCGEGLTQQVMAEREHLSLTGFRDKLRRCSLQLVTRTERAVVRLKTGEPLRTLLDRGDLVTDPTRTPAAAGAAGAQR